MLRAAKGQVRSKVPIGVIGPHASIRHGAAVSRPTVSAFRFCEAVVRVPARRLLAGMASHRRMLATSNYGQPASQPAILII